MIMVIAETYNKVKVSLPQNGNNSYAIACDSYVIKRMSSLWSEQHWQKYVAVVYESTLLYNQIVGVS